MGVLRAFFPHVVSREQQGWLGDPFAPGYPFRLLVLRTSPYERGLTFLLSKPEGRLSLEPGVCSPHFYQVPAGPGQPRSEWEQYEPPDAGATISTIIEARSRHRIPFATISMSFYASQYQARGIGKVAETTEIKAFEQK
ncbi:predicted protein [Histoplasma capsulatum var. duboisii H88]|uniref:Predicted protein n=1 Tax=Ajellomyces capsulatus (strain H88) TaxID=544711 RepID=F0UAL1_AJEC8|nr:predicted protein [Histoplasma capsulatum var. duboisii H88]